MYFRAHVTFQKLGIFDRELLFQSFSPSSPSCAFKFLKQFKKSPTNPNNLHWGSKQAICDESISELFNEYFSSVFRKPVSDYTEPTVSPYSAIKLS